MSGQKGRGLGQNGSSVAQMVILWGFVVALGSVTDAALADPWRTTTLPPAATANCGSALELAMRDLQAQVTGPLADQDYRDIRNIFSALCDPRASGRVHQTDETGRRISTRPLSESQQSRRPVPESVVLDPVLLLDLESVLDRSPTDATPDP